MTVVYEDNHIIVVNKTASEIVQADKTGDMPLSETVKQYLKEKYQKPGNVFLGVTHRLDRPVSGLVIFAKTSKALTRLNEMFRAGEVKKTYWAVVKNAPKESEGELVHFLVRNEKQNKSYAYDKEVPNSKKAYDCRIRGQSYHYSQQDRFRDRSGRQDGGYAAFGDCKTVSEREVSETRKCFPRCDTPAGPPRKRSCYFCQNE